MPVQSKRSTLNSISAYFCIIFLLTSNFALSSSFVIFSTNPTMRRFFVPKSSSLSGVADTTSQLAKRARTGDVPTSPLSSATKSPTKEAAVAALTAADATTSSSTTNNPAVSSFFAPRTSTSAKLSSSTTSATNTTTTTTTSSNQSMLSAIPHYHTILSTDDLALARETEGRLQRWTSHDGLLCKFRSSPTQTYSKVVAFDMDHTIIVPRSKSRFPVNGDDWKFWQSEVPMLLTELYAQGHGIVFLSNQQGLGDRKNPHALSEFTRKVDAVIDTLGIPIDFLCATAENRFRKPLTGMWEFYQAARGVSDMHVCFVGDAAGRPVHGTRAKDFSDTDIKFARNLHIPFYTPEKFFLKSTQRIHTEFPEILPSLRLIDHFASSAIPKRVWPPSNSNGNSNSYNNSHPPHIAEYSTTATGSASVMTDSSNGFSNNGDNHTNNAVDFKDNNTDNETNANDDSVSYEQLIPPFLIGHQEVVLLVAAPASGKSTVALRLEQEHGYLRVNRDEMGTLETCMGLAREALKQGKSVVVDNTNLNATTRMSWVKLVRETSNSNSNKIVVRAIVLDVPKEVCMQLARYRLADPVTRDADRRHIPSMVIHGFFKNKEEPHEKEGYDRIDVLPWTPRLPEHPTGQRLFRMYLS